MKTTQTSYRNRLNRVTDFLHANLETNIRIEDLADVACLSSYHWHRIYTAMAGETVAVTLRRLRLQRAADRLANSDMDIAKIAQLAQYGSQDAFTRAFRDSYDQTPAKYRAGGSHAAFKAANAVTDAQGFKVDIVSLDDTPCISVAHQGSYMQIDAAMGQLFGALAASETLTPQTQMRAVFFDDPDLTDTADLRSAAYSPFGGQPPEGTTLHIQKGGDYAKLEYTGPYADMKDAYRWLYGVWLPASGFAPSERPCFESYLNSPVDTAPQDLRSDIYLPVEAAL